MASRVGARCALGSGANIASSGMVRADSEHRGQALGGLYLADAAEIG
jgi:hypothetical protein